MNHYTHLYAIAVIYSINLFVTLTITHTKYGKALFYAIDLSVI